MACIAIDIDDTLYSFNQLAREKFAEVALLRGNKKLHRGAYLAWGEWRSPDDVSEDKDFWPHVISLCHDPATVLEQVPFSGAADTISDIVDAGYKIKYISNRSPESYKATKMWLEGWGFPQGDLICTHEDKMKYVDDCQYIIDDRPKTLVQFVYNYNWQQKWGTDKQRLGFGIFGEVNRALTDIPNIYLAPNWTLLEFYLVEKGVLNG